MQDFTQNRRLMCNNHWRFHATKAAFQTQNGRCKDSQNVLKGNKRRSFTPRFTAKRKLFCRETPHYI